METRDAMVVEVLVLPDKSKQNTFQRRWPKRCSSTQTRLQLRTLHKRERELRGSVEISWLSGLTCCPSKSGISERILSW